MCLNKPIQIPKGSDGRSTYVAFATDENGNGFSYESSQSRTYISIVNKFGSISQSDFITWVKYIGDDGDDGVSVVNVTVSDGVTQIGGVLYPLNHLVVELSTGSYIDAGLIEVNETPVWNTLTLLNSWTVGGATNTPSGQCEYTIYKNFIYFRGSLDFAGATSVTFANVPSLGTAVGGTTTTSIRSNIVSPGSPSTSVFQISGSGNLIIIDNLGSQMLLDSVPPISVR